ncbi:MAG TPA: amidohydrolase [Gemmatimonadales bacterium]
MPKTRLLFLIVGISSPALAQGPQPADLVVTHARIYTADAARPMAEALAVRGEKIVYVGTELGAAALTGPQTQKMDLGGKTVIPGMIDAHGHVLGLGEALRNVDLTGASSYEEIVARVAARAKTMHPGEWVVGRGWDQNRWANTAFPTHEALDRAVPDNPVVLSRVDGHATLVNAKAMQLANLTAATPDPNGGRIIRDANRNPTGVLVDNAEGLVGRIVPPLSHDQIRDALLASVAEQNRLGLTGVHDPGEPANVVAIYEELAKAGQLNSRVYVMLSSPDSMFNYFGPNVPAGGQALANYLKQPQSALYDGHLWIRAIKMYADGAMGSRGAAMLEQYSDEPGNTGLVRQNGDQIRRTAIQALRRGFQVNVHAIGDRGNRMTLDAFEAALDSVPTADHRFRIEHAQILNYQDIPRFAKLGVIPSMQGSHQTSDMYWILNRIGPGRVLGGYAWRALLNTGVIIPNGSDFPVESPNPLISFHAFFTRQDARGWPPEGWYPEEKTTRQEAFLSMTLWPAEASFMEDVVGTLSAGKFADFVVLDQDIMTAAPNKVLDTKVEMTVLGGKVVFKR